MRDINLEVHQGKTLGIIGRNGAGKSTFLRILAGLTPATRGKFEVHGKVFPMIGLNAGLHVELAGRENAYLLGEIPGLSRPIVQTKMPEIEKFADLGKFFDEPVRTYSTGMLARLGIAVAVNADADLLLINEGTTMGLVSHNPYLIERMCDKAMLLHQGAIVAEGSPKQVARGYSDMINKAVVGEVHASERMLMNRAVAGYEGASLGWVW